MKNPALIHTPNATLHKTTFLLVVIAFMNICPMQIFAQESSNSKGHAAQPNILFIAIDDLRPELGCYGAEHIISPNIDKLAREGIVFDRAYCQMAICMASRKSIMSGYRPTAENNLHDLDLNLDLRFRIGENLPWYAAILGGLPAVAGSAVINEMFAEDINDLSNFQYEVFGTISEPLLQRVK